MPIPRLLFCALALLALAACRRETDDLNQDRIFCEYELEYQAEHNETVARAYFKVRNASGSKLQLSEPSSIHFGSDPLIYDEPSRSYQRTYSGRRDTGTFVWLDTDANSYRNFADLTALNIDFPSNFTQISQNGNFVFAWQGSPLADAETIELQMLATATSAQHTANTSQLNATSLAISSATLLGLDAGEYRCALSRSHSSQPQQKTDAGGTIKTIYLANPVSIQLLP